MRIVVTGATGNVGTSVLRALREHEVTGIARRVPELSLPHVRFVAADVARDQLTALFKGADAVIHLAWLIQPSRDRARTRAANVDGSAARVRRRRRRPGVPGADPRLVGRRLLARPQGPPRRRVVADRTASTRSFYARDKADVERILDAYEDTAARRAAAARADLQGRRRVRDPAAVRGALPAHAAAASAGCSRSCPPWSACASRPCIPTTSARPTASPPRARCAGRSIMAAEPVLDPPELGRILGARPVPVSPRVLRALADLTWRARLQPTPPGWLDMALAVPLLDTTRARDELGLDAATPRRRHAARADRRHAPRRWAAHRPAEGRRRGAGCASVRSSPAWGDRRDQPPDRSPQPRAPPLAARRDLRRRAGLHARGGALLRPPRCACPALAAFLRGYNDGLDDAQRQDLIALAPELVGTRGAEAVTTRRGEQLVALAWRYERRAGPLRFGPVLNIPGRCNRYEAAGAHLGRCARAPARLPSARAGGASPRLRDRAKCSSAVVGRDRLPGRGVSRRTCARPAARRGRRRRLTAGCSSGPGRPGRG